MERGGRCRPRPRVEALSPSARGACSRGDLHTGLTVCEMERMIGVVTTAAPATRRSNAERSAATQVRLLDATIECLIERGWAGTRTTEGVRRAGVSRGAQAPH